MSHTPGPWVVREPCPIERAEDLAEGIPPNEQELTEVYSGDDGDQVCYVMNTTVCEAANARLIAAAPEMLAALRELVHYDEGSSEQGSYGYEVLSRCKAVIAKAEGRE